MPMDSLLSRARGLWEGMTEVPGTSFAPTGGVNVVVAPNSALSPPGWLGVVVLGGSALVTAPSEQAAAAVHRAVAGLSAEAVGSTAAVTALREVLPVGRVLGPAALAYTSREEFRPVSAEGLTLEELPAGHHGLRALEQVSGEPDMREAGLFTITSPGFAVREGDTVVAAAGYRSWPGRTAHLSVLTAPGRRGRGLAKVTGSAAVAHALVAGLLPQWRAQVPASRRAAGALGFRELGTQLSVEPG
ncbi:GNAT family N-acetyltransferase [Kitasatospora sp. NPDC056138]|uniref:GNAT family N-acetyltransferase n=1 Tax=Kitasatospora sp. NPDC056138 TaxID=3345724 RepID=UPI0035E01773